MRENFFKVVFGISVCLLCILIIAPATVVAVEDWHTGNTQLHDAINAAVVRLKQTGEWDNILLSYNETIEDLPDPLCLYEQSVADQIFRFPSNPVGTLYNILQRGYWAVASPDEYDGNTNPPGEFPDLMRAIARIVGEHYGLGRLEVRYVLTPANLGTPAVFQTLLDGRADSSDTNYILTTTTTLPSTGNKLYMRRDLANPSCGQFFHEVSVAVLVSSGINTFSELQQFTNVHPGAKIGTAGTGDELTAKVQFQNAEVIDYLTLVEGEDLSSALNADLLNGTLIAIWDYYYDGETPPPLVNVISSGIINVVGTFTRYDGYSPSFAAQCTHLDDGCVCGSGSSRSSGTEINFNFNGMLRRN